MQPLKLSDLIRELSMLQDIHGDLNLIRDWSGASDYREVFSFHTQTWAGRKDKRWANTVIIDHAGGDDANFIEINL